MHAYLRLLLPLCRRFPVKRHTWQQSSGRPPPTRQKTQTAHASHCTELPLVLQSPPAALLNLRTSLPLPKAPSPAALPRQVVQLRRHVIVIGFGGPGPLSCSRLLLLPGAERVAAAHLVGRYRRRRHGHLTRVRLRMQGACRRCGRRRRGRAAIAVLVAVGCVCRGVIDGNTLPPPPPPPPLLLLLLVATFMLCSPKEEDCLPRACLRCCHCSPTHPRYRRRRCRSSTERHRNCPVPLQQCYPRVGYRWYCWGSRTPKSMSSSSYCRCCPRRPRARNNLQRVACESAVPTSQLLTDGRRRCRRSEGL